MRRSRLKAPTRGRMLILAENAATVRFYGVVALLAALICAGVNYYFYEASTPAAWALPALSAFVNLLSFHAMRRIAQATRDPDTGALLFEGTDLNATGDSSSFAVHLKDIILLTAFLQVASLACCHVWWLWLLAPLRAVYLLWRAKRAVEGY